MILEILEHDIRGAPYAIIEPSSREVYTKYMSKARDGWMRILFPLLNCDSRTNDKIQIQVQ